MRDARRRIVTFTPLRKMNRPRMMMPAKRRHSPTKMSRRTCRSANPASRRPPKATPCRCRRTRSLWRKTMRALPPPDVEVRMQHIDAASLSPPQRKRGGQPGNRNRLKHGRYKSAFAARREKTRVVLRSTLHLVIRLAMVARMRKAMREKMMRKNSTLLSCFPPLRSGGGGSSRKRRDGGGQRRDPSQARLQTFIEPAPLRHAGAVLRRATSPAAQGRRQKRAFVISRENFLQDQLRRPP